MAGIRTTGSLMLRELFNQPLSLISGFGQYGHRYQPSTGTCVCRNAASASAGFAARLQDVLERRRPLLDSLKFNNFSRKRRNEHLRPPMNLLQKSPYDVIVSFARSGGPGGQNVNKVNTKVDMRFNVKNAYWLSDRIRERIIQMEKNRINKDGEIVVSSTKTRTQKANIDDALRKLQAIIDAASYLPPPPSEEQKKKIAKMAAIGEQKRLSSKKILSDKKAFRRGKDSWD